MKQILLVTSCIALLAGCATTSAGTGTNETQQTQAEAATEGDQPVQARTWQDKIDETFAVLCAIGDPEVQDLRLWLMNEAPIELDRAKTLQTRIEKLAGEIKDADLTPEEKQILDSEIATVELNYKRYMGELEKVVNVRNPRRNCAEDEGGPLCLNTYRKDLASSVAAVEARIGSDDRDSITVLFSSLLPLLKVAVKESCKIQLRRDMATPRMAVEELQKFDFSEKVET